MVCGRVTEKQPVMLKSFGQAQGGGGHLASKPSKKPTPASTQAGGRGHKLEIGQGDGHVPGLGRTARGRRIQAARARHRNYSSGFPMSSCSILFPALSPNPKRSGRFREGFLASDDPGAREALGLPEKPDILLDNVTD